MSTISPTQLTNTLADQFDVDLLFYAGKTYKDLVLTNYTYGIMPSLEGWTNVTGYINSNGNLTYERSGNTVSWTCTFGGVNYDHNFFGLGQAIMCLRRITANGVQTQPATGTYDLWFIGQITNNSHDEEYTQTYRWQCTLEGLNSLLKRSTAARFSAGRIDLAANSSVTASSTLLNPAIEAGSGEFPGTIVNVDPSNTIDSNINTLWISNDVPVTTALDDSIGWFDKVFMKPLTGYDQSKLWWFEIHDPNYTEDSKAQNTWYLETSKGKFLWLNYSDAGQVIRDNPERFVVCASKADFEAYTGGFDGVVIEAKSWPWQGNDDSYYDYAPMLNGDSFSIDPDDDWICLKRQSVPGEHGTTRARVCWNQDGSDPAIDDWTGGAVDVSNDVCPPGSGIRLLPDQDGGTAADYEITNLLIPGDRYSEVAPEWLFYTLEQQSAALDVAATAGDTSITLTSTTGLLDAGTAICETDTFIYTGRSSTALTGIPASGADAIGDHAKGALVQQVIAEVAQTGWPCSKFELLRPFNENLPIIIYGRAYFCASGLSVPRTPTEDDWETDYDGPVIYLNYANISDGIYDKGRILTDTAGNARWVQYMLVVFDQMSDAARARMNEVRLFLAQTQINDSSIGDIDTITAYALANYIFTLAGTTSYLYDYTPTIGPYIGEHETAIAPYPDVLDDLARITGCTVTYGLDGKCYWTADMWWDNFSDVQLGPYAIINDTHLRGKVNYSGQKPVESGVKIHARTPNGLHQYDCMFPDNLPASAQYIEYDDLVLSTVDRANSLAKTMYYKAGLNYTHGSQEATFIIKGIGEWLRPEQYIIIYNDNSSRSSFSVVSDIKAYTVLLLEDGTDLNLEDGASLILESNELIVLGSTGTSDYVSWLIESVTWTWGQSDKTKNWQATAKCRRYWR